jgi:hypothetical protein
MRSQYERAKEHGDGSSIAEKGRPTIRRRTPVKTAGDAGAKAVTTTHKLLTSSWTADVETVEAAIGRFTARRRLANDCQIVFFEIAGDGQLHVNVTHQDATMPVRGWAGPARLPGGFVHNRRFGDNSPSQIIRHIRDVVFAV